MKEVLDIIILILGISGVIAVGLQFFLEATNRLDKDHKTFAIINMYGCIALFINAFYNKVWLFAVLNFMLIGIGIYGLVIVFSKKKKINKNKNKKNSKTNDSYSIKKNIEKHLSIDKNN